MIKTQLCLMLQYNVLVIINDVLYIMTAVKNKIKSMFSICFFFQTNTTRFNVNYGNGSNSNVLFRTSLVDSRCYKYREQRKKPGGIRKKTTL